MCSAKALSQHVVAPCLVGTGHSSRADKLNPSNPRIGKNRAAEREYNDDYDKDKGGYRCVEMSSHVLMVELLQDLARSL